MTATLPSIIETTKAYEAWLRRETAVVEDDLRKKHRKMSADAFTFLRATFYRWLEQWPRVCKDLLGAPRLLAVGDLHVENFGTWRDAEGRLIWGVNDVDDVCELPYLQDLVRVATSIQLALRVGHLDLSMHDACDLVLEGYRASLKRGGRPIVLAERHAWLRDIAVEELQNPARFWQELQELPRVRTAAPSDLLQKSLPAASQSIATVRRSAGVGSLGRQRYVALASVGGSLVAREIKALAPSARAFVTGDSESPDARTTLLNKAVRVPDPFVTFQKKWMIRRLAPDCLKVELGQFPKRRNEQRFLRAIGIEIANLHLATGRTTAILRDLDHRPNRWLEKAAQAMASSVRNDWRTWKNRS
jgi:uncharacterized protein (DUF2252 family)